VGVWHPRVLNISEDEAPTPYSRAASERAAEIFMQFL